MGYVGKVTIGSNTYPIGSALYGTCTTGYGTAAKVVTCADFDQLLTGITIQVKFTYGNPGGDTTLNVNGTGAKTVTSGTKWNAGAVVSFTYDGTSWISNGFAESDNNKLDKPAVAGTAGQVLTSDGNGGQTWSNPQSASAGNSPTFYGTCNSQSSFPTKVVTCSEFTANDLVAGTSIRVHFIQYNSAQNPALNINGTGAKPIYRNGYNAGSTMERSWASNSVITFTYDGSKWNMNDVSLYADTKITKPSVAGRFGQVLTSDGEGVQKWEGQAVDFVKTEIIFKDQVQVDSVGNLFRLGVRVWPVDNDGVPVFIDDRMMNAVPVLGSIELYADYANAEEPSVNIEATDINFANDYYNSMYGRMLYCPLLSNWDTTYDVDPPTGYHVTVNLDPDSGATIYGSNSQTITLNYSLTPGQHEMEVKNIYVNVGPQCLDYAIRTGETLPPQTEFVPQTIDTTLGYADDYQNKFCPGVWYYHSEGMWGQGATSDYFFTDPKKVIRPTFILQGDDLYYAESWKLVKISG